MLLRESAKVFYRRIMRFIPIKTAIYIDYFRVVKKVPSIHNPKNFTEKIQWIKLNGNLSRYSNLVDKYEVKKFVSDKIGEKYIINTIEMYDNAEDIRIDILPNKFVMKSTNGSGYNFICKNKSLISNAYLIDMAKKWLSIDYYKEHKEEQYKNIKTRIMIEDYIEDNSGDLKDYKFFCFNGKVEFIQVDVGRFTNHKRNFYDVNWNKINLECKFKNTDEKDSEPNKLKQMINIAEKLSKGIPFVRIDLFYINNKIFFGEITFTPGNGLEPFKPKEFNIKAGEKIKLELYT